MVSIGTVDELCRTVLAWFEQNCTLPSLRPSKDQLCCANASHLSLLVFLVVMNSLKELSQRTSILSDPAQVPRQLLQYAQQEAIQDQQQGSTGQQAQEQSTLDASLYS